MTVSIREIRASDPPALFDTFRGTPWERRGVGHFQELLRLHGEGSRVVLVGALGDRLVGHVSLVWAPDYPPFREAGIPEVNDLTVSPDARRRGVASGLMDRAEELAPARSGVIGIGVGLHSGYGPAQRLYVKRGYVPDGRGLIRDGRVVAEGDRIAIDDDPVLYLTKTLSTP